jgi:hypothetical protein
MWESPTIADRFSGGECQVSFIATKELVFESRMAKTHK